MKALRRCAYFIFVGIAATAIAGCGQNKKADAEATDPALVLVTDSLTWADSIKVHHNKATVTISVDYPIAGKPELVASVREWIAQCLGAPDTTGMNAPQAFLANAGQIAFDELSDDLDADYYSPMALESDCNIFILARTPGYVTYACRTYTYQGGAHGSSTFTGATFGTPEGVYYNYGMFKPVDIERIRKMVVEGVRTQYFGVTPEEFANLVFSSPDEIALPVAPPYFTPKGVNFVYQQYEIAPYAAGLPSCIIPFDSISECFIPRVHDLLK